MAFKKSLFVPYHVPLKFGVSAKSTTLPDPKLETIKEAEPFMFFSMLFLRFRPRVRDGKAARAYVILT